MNQKPIGTRIAELRKEKGLTQTEVVEKCNVNIRTLQRIESNQVQPRMYTMRALLEAMEYDLDILNEPNELLPSSNPKLKVAHFFDQAGQLFNQNKSIMKKAFVILSLTLSAIFVVNVASTYKIDEVSMAISSDTTINSNIKKNLALLNGTWMLTVSNDFSTNKANTRYMRFDTKGQFKTINANGSPFNSGEFYLTADNKLITIHNKTKNLLRKTANYYQYSIERNNLTIKGAYLRPLMNNHYETFQVNEVWKRIEDDSLFDELNKPYSLWQSKFDNMHFIESGKIITGSVKTSLMGFWISNQISNAEFKEFWDYAKNNPNKSIEWATIENNKTIVKKISYSEITSIKISKENWPAKNYFESEKYNDDPVIGVSDQLANFYCIWKSIGLNNKINNSNLPTVNYFIPTPTQLTHATTTYPSLLSNNELGFRIALKD